jgi:hypothetical protein
VSEGQFAAKRTARSSAVEPLWCEIRVRGQLDGSWSAWFGGLAVADGADGEAVLAGELADQAALHGVLIKVRDLGLPLLAMVCREAERDGR